MPQLKLGDLIYENPLTQTSDIQGWVMEGGGEVRFVKDQMELYSATPKANFVLWCPETFPDMIRITWTFRPIRDPGLAMIFFAAGGTQGQDLFDSSLEARNGEYPQYHSGDISTLHLSYFRRKWDTERSFHTCNLRKSPGFHLVEQGADPLPGISDAKQPYHLEILKAGSEVSFLINDLLIMKWKDDGKSFGQVLSEGKIGFRQMAPLHALYANLRVHRLIR